MMRRWTARAHSLYDDAPVGSSGALPFRFLAAWWTRYMNRMTDAVGKQPPIIVWRTERL